MLSVVKGDTDTVVVDGGQKAGGEVTEARDGEANAVTLRCEQD